MTAIAGRKQVDTDLAATAEECGCAPSESERRSFFASRSMTMSRRSALGVGALSVAALGALGGTYLPRAFAIEGYPSWDDVQAAMANEGAKAGEVAKIEGLIAGLQSRVAETARVAKEMSDAFYVAQQAFFDASYRADQLQGQADVQASTALQAANKAGRVAAQLYRDGGDDTSLELFFAGSAASADNLLSRLGTMDKMVERNQAVYADAISARDAAQKLTDQAILARTERDKLQQEAEAAMRSSQAAADEAEAALAEQTQYLGTLQAQLAALKDTTATTVQQYEAGVEAERLARLERERLARIEADRLAAEAAAASAAAAAAAAAAANSGGGGGGGGGGSAPAPSGGNGGAVAGNGWARPSSGGRTSGYGYRTQQCGSSYCSSKLHAGVDMATGCGAGIYAASAGTVDYAGGNGGYGNYIRIQHGGGIGTGYAHIMSGGILVRNGQRVSAGQLIAREGNTGNSFGCHLHFEVYVNGSTTNPSDFMGARGISL